MKKKIIKLSTNHISGFETFKIDLNGHSFQVDNKNPNKFYFIKENLIYSQEFEKAKGLESLILKTVEFFKLKTKKEKKEENWAYGEQIFFRSKKNLTFVKFEKDMQHFYCDDGEIIKRFQSKNKEVVNIYDELVYKPLDMILSADESLFIR